MWQFLANELIYEILRHFIPESLLSITGSDLFPWYLGKICSTWRTVFISSPQFWSRLHIEMDMYSSEEGLPYHDSIFELVQVALKRSNSYPLSLSITMGDDAASTMRAKDILEMLVAHSMNWRDFRMHLHPSYYPTLYRAKDQLPILRSIRDYTTIPPQFNFEDTFMNATQLTRVHCSAGKIYWRINWSLVTVIHLVDVQSFDEVVPTLRQTCALETLVILMIRDRRDPRNISPVPVHLPFLKVLYLPTLMPLSLLRTPELEELYINNRYWSDINLLGLELFITTLSGYFSTVRNLQKLAIHPLDSRDGVHVLKHAPSSTRELALYGNGISKQLTSATKLHNLKTISIETRSHEITYLLAKVKAWAQERQGTTESGIGSFKNLAQFSLGFVLDRNYGILKPVKRLKRVLDEQGIEFFCQFIPESWMRTDGVLSFDSL